MPLLCDGPVCSSFDFKRVYDQNACRGLLCMIFTTSSHPSKLSESIIRGGSANYVFTVALKFSRPNRGRAFPM